MVSVTQVEGKCPTKQSKGNSVFLKDFKTHIYRLGGNVEPDWKSQSLLDSVLLSQWEDHAWKGQLHYDVTTCETKVVSGRNKFVAQLNDKWSPHFWKEFESTISQLFGSIKSTNMKDYEEILLCVSDGEKHRKSELIPSSLLPKEGILVIANENPLEYGHMFLLPYSMMRGAHLFWDEKNLELITRIATEVNNPSFCVFSDCNSSAAPNSMYFQGAYFPNPLPVELIPGSPVNTTDIMPESGIITIHEITRGYPLKTLIFVSTDLKALVGAVSRICSALHDKNSAFSLLITECGTKMFLFPQVHSMVMDSGCLSAWECGGYFVYSTEFDYERASDMEIIKRLSSVSLDEAEFMALKNLSCNIAINQAL